MKLSKAGQRELTALLLVFPKFDVAEFDRVMRYRNASTVYWPRGEGTSGVLLRRKGDKLELATLTASVNVVADSVDYAALQLPGPELMHDREVALRWIRGWLASHVEELAR